MKKLFTFVFVMFVFVSASDLEAQGRRSSYGRGRVVSFDIAPCDNKPIFFVRQVSNFLLDPGYGSTTSRGSVYIGVGSSRRSASTVSQQWMNPQLMLEAFNREFQNDGCVGAIDPRVKETTGFNSYYVSAVKALNFDIPATKDPNVNFLIISGKVLATRNTIKFGPSKKQQVTGAVIKAGTVVLACRRSGELEDGLCVAGDLLANLILAGSKNMELRQQKMEVTVQFQNAGTGYLRTITDETDYYTSENNEVVVFWNHTSATFEVFSMKEALVAAMKIIKVRFVSHQRSEANKVGHGRP